MEAMTLKEIAGAMGCATGLQGSVTEICTDSRRVTPGCLFVALKGERSDGHDYVAQALEKGAAAAVAAHPVAGVPAGRLLLVADPLASLLDIAARYRAKFPGLRLVGVTGSVGKTTTKDFIACVLSARYRTHKTQGNQNNELGVPLTVFGLTPQHQTAVVEMGMQGLGEIRSLTLALRPAVGVITNIGVSHIQQLGSRENILKAKLELCEGMDDGAPLLLNGDNDLLSGVRVPRLNCIFYGAENPACAIRAGAVAEDGDSTSFTIAAEGGSWPARIPCLGRHNVLNALAAFGVGRQLGIPAEECVAALRRYEPSGMRQRILRLAGGVTLVEDCYNASPDSMRAALTTLRQFPCAGRRIAVLADMLELGPIAEESHRRVGGLAAGCADLLLCWGPLGRLYAEGARAAGMADPRWFAEKEELTRALCDLVQPGDVVWGKASRGMKLEEALEPLTQRRGLA